MKPLHVPAALPTPADAPAPTAARRDALPDPAVGAAALNAIDAGIVVWHPDGRLAWRNRRFAQLLPDLARHFLIGRRRIEIVRRLAAEAPAAAQLLLPAADAGGLLSQEVEQEVLIDIDRPILVSHRAAGDGHVVSRYADCGQRTRREAELQQVITATLEASRSKTEFLANMSHELRTPLNAILGFADMMRNEMLGPVSPPKYREYIEDICASGAHLLGMINSILDLARIESGRVDLHPEPVCLAQLAKEARRMCAATAAQSGIRLGVVAPDRLDPIQADRRALRQVLLNLLSNAIKFTPRGGSVTVAVAAGLHSVSAVVADTGIGIPADHLPRLGRPFEQVANAWTRDHAGSGLGLAITKALVAMHGGTLTIESTVGKGTTVTVALPSSPPGVERADADAAA
ncbi:MAG: HAMP domain-containing histidine kinase [Alphaproteobacteria bacterium]|nr:HAMP domain-containing histidine kinase [Alphaproteobacteria bacterium]